MALYDRYQQYGLPGNPVTIQYPGGELPDRTIYVQPQGGVNVPVKEVPYIPRSVQQFQQNAPQETYAQAIPITRGPQTTMEYPLSDINKPLPPGQKYRFISNEAAAASGLGDALNKEYDTLRGNGIDAKTAMSYIMQKKSELDKIDLQGRYQLQAAKINATSRAASGSGGQLRYVNSYVNGDTGEVVTAGVLGGKLYDTNGNPLSGNWYKNTPQSAQERTSISNLDAIKQQINRIRGLFNASGGTMTGVGGVTGTVEQAWNPDVAEFRAAVKSLSDLILRVRSGAQTSEQEYNRIAGLSGFLPNVISPDTKFLGSLNNLEKETDFIRNSKMNYLNTQRAGVPITGRKPTASNATSEPTAQTMSDDELLNALGVR